MDCPCCPQVWELAASLRGGCHAVLPGFGVSPGKAPGQLDQAGVRLSPRSAGRPEGISLSSAGMALALARAGHGTWPGRGTGATASGSGAVGQRSRRAVGSFGMSQTPPGASALRPRCRAGPRAPGAAQTRAGDGARATSASGLLPSSFFFGWKTSLLRCLCRPAPRSLFKLLWESYPRARPGVASRQLVLL